MLPSVIALIVFFVFVALLAALFLKSVVVIGMNAIVWYVVVLKSLKDWNTPHLRDYYVLATMFAMIIVLLTGVYFPLWSVTWVALYAIVLISFAQLIRKVR